MIIELSRIAENQNGMFGVLSYEDTPFAVTLERKWLNNQRNISCIPYGAYDCKRVNSPKFGNTFEVTNVLNRSHILFHKGNLDDDSHGCILVGEQFGTLSGDAGILASKQGFNEFLNLLSDVNDFNLVIYDYS